MTGMIKIIRVKYGYIHFDFSRPELLDRFSYELLTSVQKAVKESDGTPVDTQKLCEEMGKCFDNIFGCNACKKTFGTAQPSLRQLEEFWEKFSTLVNNWAEG